VGLASKRADSVCASQLIRQASTNDGVSECHAHLRRDRMIDADQPHHAVHSYIEP
jgi:hypothetical protein